MVNCLLIVITVLLVAVLKEYRREGDDISLMARELESIKDTNNELISDLEEKEAIVALYKLKQHQGYMKALNDVRTMEQLLGINKGMEKQIERLVRVIKDYQLAFEITEFHNDVGQDELPDVSIEDVMKDIQRGINEA